VGELAALSAAAVWAVASTIFTRLGKQDLSPLALNVIKCALALAMMMITLAVMGGGLWPGGASVATLTALGVSGVIGLSIGDTAFFGALTRIGARRALLINTLSPPTTALLAWPVLDEPLEPSMALGMALTMGGVAWVISERAATPDGEAEDPRTLRVGLALGVVAMLCQSTGNVLSKLGGDVDPLEMGIVRLAFGVAGLALVVALAGKARDVLKPLKNPRQLAWIALATTLGTYLGIWLLMAGLKHTTHAAVAATLSSMSPIFVLPLAHFFLGDRLTPRAVLGAVIAVAGVALL
jgi:drug/metabolite transporter (DMT)-like permease